MNILHLVSTAGQNCRTITLTIQEESGLVHMQEVEPYVCKKIEGDALFYCYDIHKDATKVLPISSIVSVEETGNTFNPRYPIRCHH